MVNFAGRKSGGAVPTVLITLNMIEMPTLGKILVIDDNEDILFALTMLLEKYVEKMKVLKSPDRFGPFLEDFNPDIILLDMNFTRGSVSGEEGMACLKEILKIKPDAVVVMMTAYADTEKAVQAIKAGATDFISKPWVNEKVLATLHAAMRIKQTQGEVNRLEKKVTALASETNRQVCELIGEDKSMRLLRDMVMRIGATDANVLLLGENGTGKDVVARLLQAESPRRNEPFVSIDCGTISETLFESELFGYEKGAFTDAKHEKMGRLELAHTGTLFLDEIGNLSLAAQAKLLTALEKQRIVRVGGTVERPIDVRLICATNADLIKLMADGKFRQDLYYRINTMELRIPPLRERGDDIGLLANHFVKEFARKYGKMVERISPEALVKLKAYSWPGNVRELRHAIERAVVLCDGDVLQSEGLMPYSVAQSTAEPEEELNLENLERKAVARALQCAGGNQNKAAALLGITRYALYRKMEKLGL